MRISVLLVDFTQYIKQINRTYLNKIKKRDISSHIPPRINMMKVDLKIDSTDISPNILMKPSGLW